jgi:hypothetical protein
VRFTNWTGAAGILRWYGVAVGGFLFVRAISTLAGGASFAVPGTGWRSLFQLAAVAILVAGIVRPKAARVAVAAVTVIYLLATVSELVNGTILLGAIPVDMRDRIVHPLIAILGAAALYLPMAVASAYMRTRKIPNRPRP